MIIFSPCKINLGLQIKGKRPDGYHNLESVFYPVDLTDVLEIVEDTKKTAGTIQMSFSGLNIPGDSESNLVAKAYQLLHEKYSLPSLKIHLHKVIPMGAGLGGGSSDGAQMLLLINQKFNLNISGSELMNFAAKLGSDCPFFINPMPAFVSGRGEFIEALSFSLKGKYLVLIHPGIHISTRDAFQSIKPSLNQQFIKDIIARPIKEWKYLLYNDFEVPVFEKYPEIREIKDFLYECGADYSSMTGTGSAVYGIFSEIPDLKMNKNNYFIKVLPLS